MRLSTRSLNVIVNMARMSGLRSVVLGFALCYLAFCDEDDNDVELSRVVTKAGQTATLPCAFPHLGSRHVKWQRREEGQPLSVGLFMWTDDVRMSVSHLDDAHWNLVITEVRLDDADVYECQTTGQPRQHGLVQLVVEAAPLFAEVEETVIKGRGTDVTLRCQLTGSPLPVVHWITPDGRRLPSQTPVDEKIFSTAERDAASHTVITRLHVRRLQSEDFGFYKCDAFNSLGSQRRYIKLTKGG